MGKQIETIMSAQDLIEMLRFIRNRYPNVIVVNKDGHVLSEKMVEVYEMDLYILRDEKLLSESKNRESNHYNKAQSIEVSTPWGIFGDSRRIHIGRLYLQTAYLTWPSDGVWHYTDDEIVKIYNSCANYIRRNSSLKCKSCNITIWILKEAHLILRGIYNGDPAFISKYSIADDTRKYLGHFFDE